MMISRILTASVLGAGVAGVAGSGNGDMSSKVGDRSLRGSNWGCTEALCLTEKGGLGLECEGSTEVKVATCTNGEVQVPGYETMFKYDQLSPVKAVLHPSYSGCTGTFGVHVCKPE